jgi:hypothetical protein
MQKPTQDDKTVRLNAAQEALLTAIASGATDDAVLDEYLAAANDYRKEGLSGPAGVEVVGFLTLAVR